MTTVKINQYLLYLQCSDCGREYSAREVHTFCPDCQAALITRYDLPAAQMELGPERQSARMTAIELEWRQEVYIFELSEVFVGKQQPAGFSQGLDPHDSRKHRDSGDLVIKKERLSTGIESRIEFIARRPPRLGQHRSLVEYSRFTSRPTVG